MTDKRTIEINGKQYSYDERVDATTASRILGVSPRTLKNWSAPSCGKIPTYRISTRKNVWLIEDLINFSEQYRSE